LLSIVALPEWKRKAAAQWPEAAGSDPTKHLRSHCRDEPESPAVDRPNDALLFAVVIQYLAKHFYAARNRRVRDDPAVPDMLYKLILA
jgi:hypothetical protein